MRYVRMEKKPAKTPKAARTFLQRCAVQVRYTKGGSSGKWYSHGTYIAREAENGLGFNAERDDVPVAETLSNWRKEKDELFFRIIVSPEFGDRMDMEQHVRDTIEKMEFDLGTKLEWVAVVHRNTDNPHVHVALRGRRDDGSTLRIPPDYVKEGLRARAHEGATNQLGYRTEHDILDVQRREIEQSRFTGLDRQLKTRATPELNFLSVTVNPSDPTLQDLKRATEFHLECRLGTLYRMGLAEHRKGGEWALDQDFEKTLRTVQKTNDRLKTIAQFGVMATPGLPFRVERPSQIDAIEGKVIVHGQDDWSGNNYMILESVRGELLRVPQVREIAQARQNGNLEPGRYIRIKRVPGDADKSSYVVWDCGDAEALLREPIFLAENAKRLAGEIPDGWAGWLGQLRKSVVSEAARQVDRGLRL